MTKIQSVENAMSVPILMALAIALWKPEWSWALWACIALLFVSTALSLAFSTPADRGRHRKGAWLIPAATLAIAAQMVYFGAPEERTRTLLLGSGLVAAGIALFWARRRAA